MQRARELMSTPPITVPDSTTVLTALAIMRQHGVRHLIVTDARRDVRGIVSNRDYRRLLDRADAGGTIAGMSTATISEIMTSVDRLVTAGPETPLSELADLVLDRRVGSIVVMDGRRAAGILTSHDIIRGLRASLR